MQFRRIHDVRKGIVVAVSVGDGWAKFIADQKLGTGAFLTFEVVDARRLVVTLHHRSAPEDLLQHPQPPVHTGLVRDCCVREPQVAVDSEDAESSPLPAVSSDDRAQFRKILRKTHTKKQDSSRLVSATPPVTKLSSFILAL